MKEKPDKKITLGIFSTYGNNLIGKNFLTSLMFHWLSQTGPFILLIML